MTIREAFIKMYQEQIIFATQGTPLFPSVKMAQAILETGDGKHTIGTAKNLFGIKATGEKNEYWDGSVYNASTGEVLNGKNATIVSGFRAYKTFSDSIKDHSRLLMTLPRYQAVRDAKTPEEQARALQSGGYATATGYANSLINIINNSNLKELDKKKIS